MNRSVIEHIRFQGGKDFTHGFMRIDSRFECFLLEDELRNVKVQGETCFQEGFYELKIKKVLTPLTKRYRDKYEWFEYFIEITGVQDFSHLYYHIGNDDDDTEGCPLLGQTMDTKKKNGWIGRSTAAYKAFYKKIYPRLKSGEQVFVNVINLVPEPEV